MMPWTKSKFLTLPSVQQQKKCAEMLREIYEHRLKGSSIEREVAHYNEVQEWLKAPFLQAADLKMISDRYHIHLKAAQQSLKEHRLLPQVRSGDREQASSSLGIAIYLDQIRSAHNVGSIIRTAEAMALGSIYFSDDTPFVDHKQVQDASMGSWEWVKCIRGESLADLRNPMRPVVVLETAKDAISLSDFLFPEDFVLVLGNEEYGCSEKSLDLADFIVEIPLYGRKNSLNVANAFAVVAAEIRRQRVFIEGGKDIVQ
jgi:tRNA G18 (ribose-2'-O)-methylase SpoU